MKETILLFTILAAGIIIGFLVGFKCGDNHKEINRQWIEELSKRNLIVKTEHSFNWKASSQD